MASNQRVIALGFFDGVHMGHGALLRTAVTRASRLNATATAFTFDQHPTSVLTGIQVPLLSTVTDRAFLMRHYWGIDDVVISSFNDMMRLSWEDFIDYLVNELGVVHIVAGHDFHFGYKGLGTPALLQAKCKERSIGCDIIEKIATDGIIISSTYIRTLIERGDMDRACQFLGHPHTLTGQVGHGKKLGGSVLGFPTVNLHIPDGIIIPSLGVYATRLHVNHTAYLAVTNVGRRPSITNSDGHITVESFILDFEGDLYGQEIRVEFFHHIRNECTFPNYSALSEEISRNALQTREYFRACLKKK